MPCDLNLSFQQMKTECKKLRNINKKPKCHGKFVTKKKLSQYLCSYMSNTESEKEVVIKRETFLSAKNYVQLEQFYEDELHLCFPTTRPLSVTSTHKHVAFYNDEIVGVIHGDFLQNGFYDERFPTLKVSEPVIYIHSFCIKHDRQNEGIGTKLLQSLIAYFRKRKEYQYPIILGIFLEEIKDMKQQHKHNKSLYNFYTKYGFKEIANDGRAAILKMQTKNT